METKKTKVTAKPGEKKVANTELIREMVNVSNNSHLTLDVAKMLTQKLDNLEMTELLFWLRHANREISNKLSSGRRF